MTMREMVSSDSTVKFNGGTIKVSINTVEGFGETYGVPVFEPISESSDEGSLSKSSESIHSRSNPSFSSSSSTISVTDSQFSIPLYEGKNLAYIIRIKRVIKV